MWLLAMKYQTGGFSFRIGGYRVGFTEYDGAWGAPYTMLELGPMGDHYVPLAPWQGWLLTGLAIGLLVVATFWATRRRRRPPV
jgi:hypothetical protein